MILNIYCVMNRPSYCSVSILLKAYMNSHQFMNIFLLTLCLKWNICNDDSANLLSWPRWIHNVEAVTDVQDNSVKVD